MGLSLPNRHAVLRLAETFAIGAVGGTTFYMAGLPAGLVAGSIVATAIASLIGRPLMVPPDLTRVILVVVGMALGSVVTPETLRGLVVYPLSIAVLCVAIVCMTAATSLYLRVVHRWSPLTALLGASPGALAQIVAMAADTGADVRGIVVVQTMRVMLLALGIPTGLALFGLSGPATAKAVAAVETTLPALALLVAVSIGAAYAVYRAGFSGGWLFGAMLGAAALNGSGVVQARPPWWLANSAMIAMGAVTGSRFAKIELRLLVSYALASLGSFTAAISVAACFAILAAHLVSAPAADVIVAFSPGAQDTMMLLALAMHLDPVFVGAHHLARYLIVSLGVTYAATLIMRREARTPEAPPLEQRHSAAD